MEKLNYELVGKKATMEALISGEIDRDELMNIFLISVENLEISSLNDVSTEEVLDSLNNENVLFVQEVK